jgi:choline dehydrogenase-like flavoprotein
MNARSYVPSEPAQREWDVVVIGTGMGGSTAGYELARLGRRVLFLEKGLFLHGKLREAEPAGREACERLLAQFSNVTEERPEARLRAGRWPYRLRGTTSFGELEFFAPLGCGSGGSTTLYAAGLERLTPADFRPRANFPQVEDSTLPEKWPIDYEDLRPFYERAEELFRVRGTKDPLDPGGEPVLRTPPPLSPRDQHLFESFQRLGLHPYRVHVGMEFVDGCTGCAPRPCLRGCKNDAARICLFPALEWHGAGVLPQCDVLGLEAEGARVSAVRCRWRGEDLLIRAKVIVLAAGAYMTPVLLLNSRCASWPAGLANRSGLVGRNLMFHVSDFFAVNPLRRLPGAGPEKSLALNDFYFSEGEKLGTFQSAGAAVELGQIMQYMREAAERERAWWRKLASPRPIWWRKLSAPGVRLAAMAMYYLLNFEHASVWASIIEDLPYRHNRVLPDPRASSGLRFEYRYSEELRARVRSYRRRLARALRPHRLLVLSGENNVNYGHVCGTCRFGDDPRTSVLDRENRAHHVENLYIVDASFFPSSGGANPSLTIAANALRVAAAVHARL